MSEGATEHAVEHAVEHAIEHDRDQTVDDSTGLASVDSVVRSVEQLEGRPVDEHVAVFEEAHQQLRRALDDAPDQ